MPYKDREKQKASNRKRQDRLRGYLYTLKESTPCKDCHQKFPYYVMQFDHREDKKFSVSQRSASFGSKYFNEEVAKCDIVCANCHAIRTFTRRQDSPNGRTAV